MRNVWAKNIQVTSNILFLSMAGMSFQLLGKISTFHTHNQYCYNLARVIYSLREYGHKVWWQYLWHSLNLNVPHRLTDSMIDLSLWHYFQAVGRLGIGEWLMEKLCFVFCEGCILLHLLPGMKQPLRWAVQTCIEWAAQLSWHSGLITFFLKSGVLAPFSFFCQLFW